MGVTNLKGATIKFGDPLAACNYNWTKFDITQQIMRRESLHAANYPYRTTDREGSFCEGSMEFERVSNLKSATLTLGGGAIGHNFTKFDCTENVMRRESLHAANYPYVTKDIEGKYIEGSVECELVDGQAYPSIDVDSVAMVVTITGLSLTATVELNNLKISEPTELGSKATLSFDFRTINGTYTYTLTTSGLPSIHQVSVPMEVVGPGISFVGPVELNAQKVSVSAELGSKMTISQDFRTVDGTYTYSEVAA